MTPAVDQPAWWCCGQWDWIDETFRQKKMLFPLLANQRENRNENGTKFHIWGEI